MRRVKFKKWKSGKGWDSDFIHEGLFHQWGTGCDYDELKGLMIFTIALIELPTGEMIEVRPEHLKFQN